MALPASAKELYRSRLHSSKLQDTWVGKRVWECATADADATEEWLLTQTWTAGSTALAQVLRPVGCDVNPHYRTGKALVEVNYATFYNPITHPVGRATISVYTRSEPRKSLAVEVNNVVVQVGGEPDANGFFWQQVSGNAVQFKHGSVVEVSTAYARGGISWSVILNAHDKVNAYALPNLGRAAAGTMLLMGASVPKYYLLDYDYTIVPINYLLWYNEKGWDRTAKIQKYRKYLTAQPVIHSINTETGAILGYYDDDWGTTTDVTAAKHRTLVRTEPVGTAVDCPELGLDVSTFSHLMGLVSWIE